MKKIDNCSTDNCIHTSSNCIDWFGGDIKFLDICDGAPLDNVIWDLVNKVEELSGDNLVDFDIDSLLEICSQAAPLEITIVSILNVIKNNEICLKDFITTVNDRVSALSDLTKVNANLKCYATADNLGNTLTVTRDSFDQLIIDNLCNHKQRIESLEGEVTNLQSQIDNIDTNITVNELSFGTCINAAVLPTSEQVINTSLALCDLITATGTTTDIATALALTPTDLNAEFGLISGWILTPVNEAQTLGNMILEIENLRQRVKFMEDNCCKSSCDDIELGFSALFNEDSTSILIKFTTASGTSIPTGFIDEGSTGTVTDKNGNVVSFTIDIVDNFTNNNETEVSIAGLDITGKLTIKITAKLGNDTFHCEKCIDGATTTAGCPFCTITATGDEGSSAVIVYQETVTS